MENKYSKVYEMVYKLLIEKGKYSVKEHGSTYFLSSKDGKSYLALDTWNGYINYIREAYSKDNKRIRKINGNYKMHYDIGITFNKGKVLATRERKDDNIVSAYKFILQNT